MVHLPINSWFKPCILLMYEDYDRRFLLEGHSTALDELVECLPAVLKYLSQLARRQPKVTSFGHGGADFVFSSTGAI